MDQTRAPLLNALEAMRDERIVPFDVPGHKRGKGNPELTSFLGERCLSVDVNSMKPLDNLCHPVSVIRRRRRWRRTPSARRARFSWWAAPPPPCRP